MNFTKLETLVFNTLARASMKGAPMDGEDLARELDMSRRSVGGVLASLRRKGKVVVDEPRDCPMGSDPVAWPVHPEHGAGFWGDSCNKEDFEAGMLPEPEGVRSEEAAEYSTDPELPIDQPAPAMSDDEIIAEAQRIIKRRWDQRGTSLTSPRCMRDFLGGMLRVSQHGRCHEHFGAVFLDTRHRVLEYAELFHGTIDSAHVHPRVVVERALAARAAAVVVTHNHPSGDPEPSQADLAITRRLRDALALVDIRLIDHFIVGDGGLTSLAERGLV